MASPFTKQGEEYVRDVVWNGYDANLRPEVVEVLNQAAQLVDFPITLKSGYRDPERNRRADGAKKSQHLTGNAVDISLKGLTDQQRTQLTRAMVQAGGKRLGVYSGNSAMHLDMAAGYKAPKGYSVYPMYDRSFSNMDRAPGWFTSGLNGAPVPKVGMASDPPIPVTMTAGLRQASLPVPATMSSLGQVKRGLLPLPTATPAIPKAFDSPRTPQQVASLYDGILPARRSSIPPIPGSSVAPRLVGNTAFTEMGVPDPVTGFDRHYDASNRMSTGGLGALLGRQPMGVGGSAAAGAGVAARGAGRLSLPSPMSVAGGAQGRLGITASVGGDMAMRPAWAVPPVPRPFSARPLPPLPASIPQTDAERQWAGTNFRDPYSMPGVGMPKFADIAAAMGRTGPVPPIPATMGAGMRPPPPRMLAPIPATMSAWLRNPPSVPLQSLMGGASPMPMPQASRPPSPVIAQARNGYFYQQTANGWQRVDRPSSLRSPDSSSSGGSSSTPQSLVG